MNDRLINDILVSRGILTAEQIALVAAQHADRPLQEAVVAAGVLDEDAIVRFLADELSMPVLPRIEPEKIPPELIRLVPIRFAKQHKVLPIGKVDGGILVALADPLDSAALDDLRAVLGAEPIPALAGSERILEVINQVYEREASELGEKDHEAADELPDILDVTDEAPVIRWVNSLFFQAVRERASDIHIEAGERDVIVRYRIDGDLYERKRAVKGWLAGVISRVKVMAGLNIAEKRLPQDGRIGLKIAGKSIDVRVSTIPTSQGERVVMRLLDKTTVLRDLSTLGLAPGTDRAIDTLIRRPHGIILVTGPTGCGKTTTLYACLQQINTKDLNIMTVEDPVEYDLPGISQMHVNPKIELTFASGLRAFLRQDPDVIMVGEIRDRETAEIAIHASLTGHLVLSTIHTNDAAGAITRLVEMGTEPFLVASSMVGILAQRLVRTLCPNCAQQAPIAEAELTELGGKGPRLEARFARQTHPAYMVDNSQFEPLRHGRVPLGRRKVGCPQCLQTGFLGRTGIYELLLITDRVRALINERADSTAIKRAAVEEGMETLRDDGMRKVLEGVTTADEVLRATEQDIEEG
ncbi:MAG: type II secretion system ATPase GspE [Deltaproteobacteria bacterium]|nr:type II secretion system ATPase GspE [Deltaproteobacteria bacterium]